MKRKKTTKKKEKQKKTINKSKNMPNKRRNEPRKSRPASQIMLMSFIRSINGHKTQHHTEGNPTTITTQGTPNDDEVPKQRKAKNPHLSYSHKQES